MESVGNVAAFLLLIAAIASQVSAKQAKVQKQNKEYYFGQPALATSQPRFTAHPGYGSQLLPYNVPVSPTKFMPVQPSARFAVQPRFAAHPGYGSQLLPYNVPVPPTKFMPVQPSARFAVQPRFAAHPGYGSQLLPYNVPIPPTKFIPVQPSARFAVQPRFAPQPTFAFAAQPRIGPQLNTMSPLRFEKQPNTQPLVRLAVEQPSYAAPIPPVNLLQPNARFGLQKPRLSLQPDLSYPGQLRIGPRTGSKLPDQSRKFEPQLAPITPPVQPRLWHQPVSNFAEQRRFVSQLIVNPAQQPRLTPMQHQALRYATQPIESQQYLYQNEQPYPLPNIDHPKEEKEYSSCFDYLKDGHTINSAYTITDSEGKSYGVWCDFRSEPGFAWTLIMSSSLRNRNMTAFCKRAMYVNAPVHQDSPNWEAYRLSLERMDSLAFQSTHWRSTTGFLQYGVDYRDYVRGSFSRFDIMESEVAGECKDVDYVNIRGFSAFMTKAPFWQRDGKWALHIDSSHMNCPFQTIFGTIVSENNFGHYCEGPQALNMNFRGTENGDSTTQWWFGGHQ